MPDSVFLSGPDTLLWVQQHLPQVLAATGQQPTDWQRARRLSGIARRQLQQHYGSGPASPAADMVLLSLERLDTRLQHPASAQCWPFAQQQLGRIMPLVERLLAA
jgi:hypothetical protein